MQRKCGTERDTAWIRFFTVLCVLYSVRMGSTLNIPARLVVGAVPTISEADFKTLWRPTFETFLNQEVGSTFAPPVSFSLVVLNLSSAFDAVSKNEIDFIFVNPSLYSCLDLEFSGDLCSFHLHILRYALTYCFSFRSSHTSKFGRGGAVLVFRGRIRCSFRQFPSQWA